jgi:hypothetical protein
MMTALLRSKIYGERISESASLVLRQNVADYLQSIQLLFDEVLLLTSDFLPVITITYREGDNFPSGPEIHDLKQEYLNHDLKPGEFCFIVSANGTSFDILICVSENSFLAVNNTKKTIADLVPLGAHKEAYLRQYINILSLLFDRIDHKS